MAFHLFGRRPRKTYDQERLTPALRSSICTGEKVAGFLDRETGKFQEIALIQSPRDLQTFLEEYGITEPLKTIY